MIANHAQASPEPPANPARALGRRSLATLAAVAGLLLLNQAIVQPPLLELATDAPVLNIAGRQRMLSQRLAKAALKIDREGDPEARLGDLSEFARVLGAWTDAHDRLRLGRNSAEVRRAFDEIQPSFEAMRVAAGRLLGGEPREGLRSILDAEGGYLARMERIVGLYERETRSRVDRLREVGWALTGLILLMLAAVVRAVLLPAFRLIGRQFAGLAEARDALEGRVRERTVELEGAYETLAKEVGERLAAESRHRDLLERFGQAWRANTVGEMASGLSHELNQPLGAIANYAEGCLVLLEAPAPDLVQVRAALGKITDATLRAGRIIRGIRRFVSRGEPGREPFEPNRVVEEVAGLCRDEANRRGIALVAELAPDLPILQGDPVQILQVLVNLVRNAFESLGASHVVGPRVVMKTARGPDGGAEFLVIDNGEGIPEARRGSVFDAFFSTRAEGMGMGLAISRTIVEAHHGRIGVESAPGARTTFRFTLPADGGDDAAANAQGHDRR